MGSEGEERLRAALRRWRRRLPAEVDGSAAAAGPMAVKRPDEAAPGCTYGVLVQGALQDVRDDLREIKDELAWVRRVVLTAVVSAAVGTLLRLAGWV